MIEWQAIKPFKSEVYEIPQSWTIGRTSRVNSGAKREAFQINRWHPFGGQIWTWYLVNKHLEKKNWTQRDIPWNKRWIYQAISMIEPTVQLMLSNQYVATRWQHSWHGPFLHIYIYISIYIHNLCCHNIDTIILIIINHHKPIIWLHIYMYIYIPIVPHKAVAEVSKKGNL
jgi:hypothetical protein